MNNRIECFLNDIVLLTAQEFTIKYADLIPFWDEIVGFNQANPAHYATLDWHIIDAMDFAKSNLIVKLALLFHDHGKLFTQTFDNDGIAHYYDHARKSAEIFLDFAIEHNIPVLLAQSVVALIKNHTSYNIRPVRAANKLGNLALLLGDMMLADKQAHNVTKHADRITDEWYASVEFFLKQHTQKNKDLTLTLMLGLPKSGKSSFVKTQYDVNTVVISRDAIRMELGGSKNYFDEEAKVTELFNLRLYSAIQQRRNIIIDNTNLKKDYRNEYRNLARKNGYLLQFNEIITDYHTLLERAKKDKFPLSVIKSMALNYIPLQDCECLIEV